jgi:hypothetical protein
MPKVAADAAALGEMCEKRAERFPANGQKTAAPRQRRWNAALARTFRGISPSHPGCPKRLQLKSLEFSSGMTRALVKVKD